MIELRLLVRSNNIIGVKEQLRAYMEYVGDTTILSVKVLEDDKVQVQMEERTD